MRRLTLALALLTATPVEAHCFTRWFYPWPQGCQAASRVTREVARWPHAPSRRVARVTPTVGEQAFVPPSVACCADPSIPLPSLARADCDGGEADEAIRARVLLRAALEAANAR